MANITSKQISRREGIEHGVRGVPGSGDFTVAGNIDSSYLVAGDRVETFPARGTFGTFVGMCGDTIVIDWDRPSNAQQASYSSFLRGVGRLTQNVGETFAKATPEQIKAIGDVTHCLGAIAAHGDIGLVSYVEEAKEALDRLLATSKESK